MEGSQPLSIESFSYGWLVNLQPAIESLDNSLTTSVDASIEASNSFIEMDPRMPPSKRFFNNSQLDFKFDFPISLSPYDDDDGLVDADELFSNGYLMPHFVSSPTMEAYHASDSISDPITLPPSSSSSHAPKPTRTRCPSLKRCRTLSIRVFQKYLNFLRPLCRRLRPPARNYKSSSNPETLGKRAVTSSPRISVAYSANDWRKSCDSESSIYEAVLHCKRSFERMS